MSSSIRFFAVSGDDEALRGYAESIGLRLLHPMATKLSEAELAEAFKNSAQGGFFSFKPIDELHPIEQRGGVLCEVIDPLLDYVRPHYVHPYLVAGQVIWNSDVSELAQETKPYFQKLRRWVQKNWRRREEDKYYVGPDAEELLAKEGVQAVYMPPSVTVQARLVD